MWSTIESFKESLSQIASDVQVTAEELEAGGVSDASAASSSHLQLHSHRRPRAASQWDDDAFLHPNGKENGIRSTFDMANGSPNAHELQKQIRKLQAREKDLLGKVSGSNIAYASLKDAHAAALTEITELRDNLERERASWANANLRSQKDTKMIEDLNQEIKLLISEKQKMSLEIMELQHHLEDKMAENRRASDHAMAEALREMELKSTVKDEKIEYLQGLVKELENKTLQLQGEIQRLQHQRMLPNQDKKSSHYLQGHGLELGGSSEQIGDALRDAEQRFEMGRKDVEKRLDAVCAERDKALRDLKRLKQHLIQKEQMDSEKMDQDNVLITQLKEKGETSALHVAQLEQSLAHALARQGESSQKANEQLEEANCEISRLKKKLAVCSKLLESKESELLNLQAALGQYYAESEAKDRLHEELSAVKKELALVSDNLKAAKDVIITKNLENNELSERMASQQRKVSESQEKNLKLEADVLMLRRALEQSLTRLNRMSSDSDYYVDRRIVVKLLVTYFQRHQSKEVLDLMSRMLGFSEDDKKAIGLAHQGDGKGVVRGVLGLPGRVVGGLLKSGSSPSVVSFSQMDTQSFADLWIDFLLKESEEREKREVGAAESRVHEDQKHENLVTTSNGLSLLDQGDNFGVTEFSNVSLSSSSSPPVTRSFRPSHWQ